MKPVQLDHPINERGWMERGREAWVDGEGEGSLGGWMERGREAWVDGEGEGSLGAWMERGREAWVDGEW